MISNKNLIILVLSIILFLGIVVFLFPYKVQYRVTLNGKTFSAEVADTQSAQQKGLSGHKPISASQSMLFVFQKSDKYGFWMKDMTFPIDIIWIDQDLRVIHIEKHISPQTYPKIFYPNTPAQYVLEIQSGQSDAISIKIGDSVKILKK